ncbi:MAG TPA: hypothetical protein VL588_13270 [Bdellovibrionota bacterium]|nr:hypothetical protein [Bdellovibrionota bacterium]
MNTLLLGALTLGSTAALAAAPAPVDYDLYRSLVISVRTQGAFRVPMPDGHDLGLSFHLELAQPLQERPLVADLPVDASGDHYVRAFWDRLMLKDGSALNVGTDRPPLTCVYVQGQDNRFSGKTSPLTPDFLLKVYLVANDFSCTGPINPGWPETTGVKETWDTYLYYEVRDPTLMLPTAPRIRYRWNEFQAVFWNGGLP